MTLKKGGAWVSERWGVNPSQLLGGLMKREIKSHMQWLGTEFSDALGGVLDFNGGIAFPLHGPGTQLRVYVVIISRVGVGKIRYRAISRKGKTARPEPCIPRQRRKSSKT